MTVSLLEILAAARAHAAPLAAESAGYLLLAVADHVAVAPRPVKAEDVELLQDGTVRLRPRRNAAEDASVERIVRGLLARTLSVSSSVGPSLRRASERRDEAGLAALVRELESALIPVNRSAAKRALSRLHRETERARAAGKLDAALASEAAAEPAPVVVAPPVVAPPVAVAPAPAVLPVVEEVLLAAEFPDPSPVALPLVAKAPTPPPRAVAPAVAAASMPMPVLTLTPEPQIAVGEPAFTKPEPVVLRKRERGSRTPQLGTLITAQTLPGEETELTERAPAVVAEEELDIEVDVDVDVEVAAVEPALSAPQPLVDPEPSCMPDVVMAMVALHAGVDADEAPTRLRDVVTAVVATPAPRVVAAPVVVESVPAPVVIESVPVPAVVAESVPEPAVVAESVPEPAVAAESVPAPAVVEATPAPFVAVAEPVVPFVSELADPAVHDALTWNPPVVANTDFASSLPAAFLIAEPAPEPSPFAPAVLPSRSSDVSELLDSFYVSGAAEEQELRSALKEMAGLSLTPMPVPLIEEG